jgi:GTP-binding protein HflX
MKSESMNKAEQIPQITVPEEAIAILVGMYGVTGANELEGREQLMELEELAKTFGIVNRNLMFFPLKKFDAKTFVTSGKVEEIHAKVQELGANLVIFDEEISPAQQRSLEEVFQCYVMDRAELILGVFAQRAQTREAKLQIELARTKYMSPRLKRMWTHLHRQSSGGGGAHLKGEGEKQIEIDRRLLQRRVDHLNHEIEEVAKHRDTQRNARERSGIPVFAIIGYTNAGKSTLLNALTDAQVLCEDKLFATLDTTTRKFALPNKQEILLIDTVGFIRKLPHGLIAAFRSTLEEATKADILIHLVDVSHPSAKEHMSATQEVLKELGGDGKPMITVLNKVDKIEGFETQGTINRLKLQFPNSIQISALNKTGFDQLLARIVEELSNWRRRMFLRIPQKDYAVISEIRKLGHIVLEEYEENDVLLEAEIPPALAGRISPYEVAPFEKKPIE